MQRVMRWRVRSVLGGVCLAAALLPAPAVRAEGVPRPRIDVPMPDIRASIMARLQHAPRLPMRQGVRPAAPLPYATSKPAGNGTVRPPTAPKLPKAPSATPDPHMSESPPDTTVHRVVDPTRRDDHVPMPDKSVTVRTLDDLDRLEAQYFHSKPAESGK